jgi:hypothetical protein
MKALSLLTIVSLLSLSSALSDEVAILTLTNGDHFPVSICPTSGQKSTFRLSSPYLSEPVDVPLSALDSLEFQHSVVESPTDAQLVLKSGETIHGQLITLKGSHVQFLPSWGTQIEVSTDQLAELKVAPAQSILYQGTSSANGWIGLSTPDNKLKSNWSLSDDRFVSQPPGGVIARDMAMPSAVHLRVALQTRNFPFVKFSLWGDAAQGNSESAQRPSITNFSILGNTVDVEEDHMGYSYHVGYESMQINATPSTTFIFDIFADRENARYLFYKDGTLIHDWQAGDWKENITDEAVPKDQAERFGTALLIRAFDNNTQIHSLEVSRWNGISPGQELQTANESLPPLPPDEAEGRDVVTLVNGDAVRGKTSTDENGNLIVETALCQLTIPRDRILQVQQATSPRLEGDSSSQPPVTFTSGIKLSLVNGSVLYGELVALSDESCTISSPTLGKLVIPTTQIVRLSVVGE